MKPKKCITAGLSQEEEAPPTPQSLAKQLTLSQSGGADYAHCSTTSPSDFQTLRRPCIMTLSLKSELKKLKGRVYVANQNKSKSLEVLK